MDTFYENFLESLAERYPVKSALAGALADLLRIEKESVYRRLRGDVNFTAHEVMRVAAAWNLSLDRIVAGGSGKTAPFRLKMISFVDPTEEDYAILEQHNRDLELVAADPDGVAVEILNALPRGLYARSEHLTRFFNMKWRHLSGPEEALPFARVEVPPRMRRIDLDYIAVEHRFPRMHSIHDPGMIENLVRQIVYYRSIGMVTRPESLLLRDELLALVDYLEEVTLTGGFSDAPGKICFYLSHTGIETEYLLFRAAGLTMSMIKVMERCAVTSLDAGVLERFMQMARAAARTSVLMSQSNALQQAEFFGRQREIISSLASG